MARQNDSPKIIPNSGARAGISRRSALALCAMTGAAAAAAPGRCDDLAALVKKSLGGSGVPGVSVAGIEDGHVAWTFAAGLADTQRKTPVCETTVFQAASLTKTVFGYLVARLVQHGVLCLDVPLRRYLPKLHVSDDPAAERITARMVLSHSSGLPLTHFPEWPVKMDFAPGEGFGYSGAAYMYLQAVVEHLTGKPLNDLLTDHVARPLEWRQSGFVWRPEYETEAATAYEFDGKAVLEKNRSRPEKANAAGSLHATAAEYARFVCALFFDDGATALPLDPVRRRMFTSPQVALNERLGWGLGWGVRVEDAGDHAWHWGDSRGFMAYTSVSLRTRSGLVALTNGRHGLRFCESLAVAALGEPERQAFSWIYEEFYRKQGVEIPAPGREAP